MKSLKQFLPESFLTELAEGPTDSGSPISGNEADSKPDPASSEMGHRELHVGDPVTIKQGVQFAGKTGDVESVGQGNKFVVVNLYNYGKHSFHSSDVEFNDYADDNDDDSDDRALDNIKRLSGY